MIARFATALAFLTSSVSSFVHPSRGLAQAARINIALFSTTKTVSGTDYANQIEALSNLLDTTKDSIASLKEMAKTLKEIELQDPHLSDIGTGTDAEALRKAVAEAKAACDAFGHSSPEAMLAWDEVDAAAEHHAKQESHPSFRYSAAALKAHHSYDAVVDTQLLSDSISALDTVEALAHFVSVEQKRLEEKGSFQ